MAITLDTLPAWTRTAVHTDYGGHVNKTDYLSQGAIDALTDVTAADICRIATDLAALVRTAPFCVITYTCNDSSPAAPTVHSVYMMTGISASNYAGDSPPSGFPTLARVADGRVTITFASTYDDDYGTAGGFAIATAVGSVHGTVSAAPIFVFDSATVLTVRAKDHADAALADAKITVCIG